MYGNLSIWLNDRKSIQELNIFMGKLFKQNFFVSLFEELFTWEKASSKPVLFLQQPFSMLLFPSFILESSVFHLDVYSTLHRKTLTHILPIRQVRSNCVISFMAITTVHWLGIFKRGSCVSWRDAASMLGRGFFKFFTLSARYMYHADNVEVNPFFLDSPAYCKRLQSISDRNSSVDFLFKAVKDKMPECGFLKEI